MQVCDFLRFIGDGFCNINLSVDAKGNVISATLYFPVAGNRSKEDKDDLS